jgi:hypothetical protein
VSDLQLPAPAPGVPARGWVVAIRPDGILSNEFDIECEPGHEDCAVLQFGMKMLDEGSRDNLLVVVFRHSGNDIQGWVPMSMGVSPVMADQVVTAAMGILRSRGAPIMAEAIARIFASLGLRSHFVSSPSDFAKFLFGEQSQLGGRLGDVADEKGGV